MLKYWAKLYKDPTRHELLLEPEVARLGERYRFQHPFFSLFHFADFALMDRRLVIEVDGASHNTLKQKAKDLKHTLALKVLGWDVVRVTNDEVEANPRRAVQLALAREAASRQTTAADLQGALDRLLQVHPELLVPPAKRPRRAKSPRAVARRGPRKPRGLSETADTA